MSSPFVTLATTVLDSWLGAHPSAATGLGDHTHDHRLDDPSPAAADGRRAELRVQLAGLDAVEVADRDEDVDRQVLRTELSAELFDLDELREAEWNPMAHNPGGALYALASRPYAPAAQRVAAARARLAEIPRYLVAARERLGELSRPHVETARAQLAGTVGLIDELLPALAAEAGAELGDEADAARTAVEEHRRWLKDRLDSATRDPRIGPDLFRAKLALTLDTDFAPADLLARAEDDLDRVGAQLLAEAGTFAATAAASPATVREVLDELAREVATDDTILQVCRDAMVSATDFVRAEQLVTVYDDPVEVIEMPEIDRGVAGAYCNPSGPLEARPMPTQFAVSPTPEGWSQQRIDSYFREYNLHMLHDLTVHEAMPGHALQLMHSNRNPASTPVRAVFFSGSFVEGWAVYAEELMAVRGYRRAESARAASALRLQQLKMQLRSILNTILDIRFHCHGLTEADAMRLMTERAFQEEAEAVEKWQRVQLTSAQLCTYYVGYREVRDLVTELRAARPDDTDLAIHDAVLGHGSPPVRHLRTLLLAQ
ncbi:MAG TPA: DUF885 domain-containing protein [Jatrophihabitans sp.]|jgi:hypothetical protein